MSDSTSEPSVAMARVRAHDEAVSDFNQGIIDEFRANNGTVTAMGFGRALALVHSTGAKSGEPRVNPLAAIHDDEGWLLPASAGGSPKNPAWYHNLKAHPDVEVNVGTERLAVTARPVLPEDPDYARLWRIVNDNNANRYEAYQKRTTRPIPIVVLEP